MKAYNKDRMIHINYVKDELVSSVNQICKHFYAMKYSKMDSECDKLIQKIMELKKSISNEE